MAPSQMKHRRARSTVGPAGLVARAGEGSGTSGGPLCHLQACIGRHKRWGSCHRSGSDDAHGLVHWLQLEDRVSQARSLNATIMRRRRRSSNKPPAVISHPVKPAPSLGIDRRVNHPQQGLTDGSHPGEFEDAAFKPAHPCARKHHRYISAAMPIVTTSRAERPARSPFGKRCLRYSRRRSGA